MQITIIKRNDLAVFVLPPKINGNFWLTDYENGKKINLINIEATENGWTIISNQNAFILDKQEIMIPQVILKDYSFYILKNIYKEEKYYIYCSPIYEKNYMELGVNVNDTISIGSGNKNQIIYTLAGISEQAFSITKNEQNFLISALDSQSALYVNHERVVRPRKIEYGDVIFLFGLKIIPMRKNGTDYLLINNPGNMLQFNASLVNIMPISDEFIDNNEIINDDSFTEEDSFYRTPHFYRAIKPFSLAIDVPPNKKEEESTPALLTIGPMVTMSMTSVVMLISQFNAIGSGEKDLSSSMTSIIMAIVMLASCLLWPSLTRMYQKFSDKQYEKKRQKLYKKYLDKKELEIEAELQNQKNTLIDNYFSVAKCQEIIRAHNVLLWQRRVTDSDFLTLPVGIGNLPMAIQIEYPEEHFSLEKDILLDMAHELGKKNRILENVPITYSFLENNITGIVGDERITKEFIDRIVLQCMANYSYDELKIVTFTSKGGEDSWDYIKTIPHSWSNDKTMRFFGSNNDDYREIIYVLEKIYQTRKNSETTVSNGGYSPYYLIVTDAIKSVEAYDFIKNVMKSKENYGFSIIMSVDRISALPNECKNFIEVNAEECHIFSSILNMKEQNFKIDFSPLDNLYACAEELANIPIDIKSDVEASLPDSYQFLEMYQVGKVEQLNSLERWTKNNPVLSLQAPIGVGKSGEIINLDLHEKYHGPHGLIAGTTGSGKSEFIITYILSLAVNYHPYEVQVILIDYKGGSLAGAFKTDTYALPHLAGTITNLDGNELNRSLASIESEVKRRQREFNDAKKIANESTIDIYKYQKLWREGKLKQKNPIAHLFIICDEFAELKEQQPEFMDKLISVARVGRSLGIHLILATQKPGGVVDSQIWSNTRFRVCLKVQDTGDSQEVLKKADAAYLKKTGRFYLQVGYDEVYTLGQSAWAGGQYYPNPTFKKEVDTSVNIINNIAYTVRTQDIENVQIVKSSGEELPNVVKYLADISKEENIKVKKLWLDKIPAKIYIDSLKKKYQFVRKQFIINPIIGEYDDPSKQEQYALTIPLTESGNALIYGIAGSGKEQFLNAILYSCITSYAPEEVNMYILDFGAETLKMYDGSPYVGDVVLVNDQDKVVNLFKMINKEMIKRKNLFANFGGSYQSYIKNSKDYLPNLLIMINNFESFSENYEEQIENLNQISRESFKYGIYFILTAGNTGSVRLKTRQNFALTYVLEQNDEMDFSSLLGNCHGKEPAKLKGRGLFKKDGIYEFQTASIVDEEKKDLSEYIKEINDYQRSKVSYRSSKIPVLPEIVDFDYVKTEQDNSCNVIVGVNKNQLNIEKYNIYKSNINLVCCYELEKALPFVKAFATECSNVLNSDFLFLSSLENDFSNMSFKNYIYQKHFDVIFDKISIFIEQAYNEYVDSEYNEDVLKKRRKMICFIYGVSDIINKLKDETKKKFSNLMKQNNMIDLVTFIFVENPDLLRSYIFEEWFKANADMTRGIFVGNGFADQSVIKVSKITKEDREEIPNDYGFIVNMSKASQIKLLQMEEEN